MKILITGAAGFLGSHLVDRFLKEGHQVIGVDNLVTGRMQNIDHIKSGDFTFINADASESLPQNEDIKGVLHFASPASPVDFARIPLEIMDVNSAGTRRCLDLAKKNDARFLMASTSEVYGDPLVHPQNEEYYGNVNPCGERSIYDESKRFSESLIYAYRRKFNLDVGVARIFNTYGPRMRPDDGRVIPAFVNQALSGKPLTVFGSGYQTRSFCYVSDLIEGIYRLFVSRHQEPVNIGNPDEFTMLELVETLGEIIDKKLEVEFRPIPENDPKRRRPDIGKARQILGWQPEINLEEGLRRTIGYFKG